MRRYFPAFLHLEGKRCLVVGGGAVAEQKVRSLLDAGARVLVVCPAIRAEGLRTLAAAGAVEHRPRDFEEADVEGAALVIGATDRGAVNAAVAAAARRRGIWVNIADTPAECDFIAPAVVRRGRLQIAISTGGASPALAKRLRQEIEREIGPEYETLVEFLGALRARVADRPPHVRRALFERAVSPELRAAWRRGDRAEVAERLAELLEEGSEGVAHG